MSRCRTIEICSSARLHFGLWAWGAAHERQFGGVGMMVNEPAIRLQFTPSKQFVVSGPAAQRVRLSAERCCQRWQLPQLPDVSIAVELLPPRHAGFGVGTQLALSVTHGLAAWLGRQPMTPHELAMVAGRGLRSAVGTYGFARGGIIVDAGKRPGDEVGALQRHLSVPDAWRVLLITPRDVQGMAGAAEREAFASLPAVPLEVSQQLRSLALEQLVPACEQAEFDRFASAVYEYGRLAGNCFATVQGGAYASPQVAATVQRLRRLGARGVGQSSWGPTVFAFAPDEPSTIQLAREFSDDATAKGVQLRITAANNTPATLTEKGTGMN